MKKEVSCRVIQFIFDYAAKCGVSVKTLCEGVPYAPDYLRNKDERVEWDVYCRIMANLRPMFSDEELERMGFGVTTSIPFRNVLIIARLLFTGPEIYSWWTAKTRGPGRQLFGCISPSIEQLGQNHLVVTLTLPASYQYCREFFVVTKGSLSAGPEVIGLGPARVLMQETEFGAVYDIRCPEGGGALSWLRRTLTWPFAVRTAASELRDANEALHERYAQLEEARDRVQRQATQLKVAYDLSRPIRANMDFDSTLKAIATSLVEIAGFAGVALSVDTTTEEERVKRLVHAGVNPLSSLYITRPLDSHGKRIGEVNLAIAPGSVMTERDELLDYIVPTIAMEIDDALSFKLVIDYRNSLQRKVEERTRELNSVNESLKKAQAGRDRLFSNISHEFRTPLTLILGPLEKILDETGDVSVRRRLLMMKKNSGKLLNLINQLLDLSRLESGGVMLSASESDLVKFLRGVVMSYRSLADTRHVRLTLRTERQSIPLYLDQQKAETLFNNLLVNAFKFTPDGGRIDIAIQETDDVATVAIRDSGPGIPEGELPLIFDRFYQGSAKGERSVGGTGIGLALAKELTELHHGTIRARSSAGVGTEFVVSLPLGKSHLSVSEIVVQSRHLRTGESHPGWKSEIKRDDRTPGDTSVSKEGRAERGRRIILVIDDDPDVRQYICDIIAPEMQVGEAADGDEGISRAQKTIPDLIISDIMMPRKDGNEVCRILKGDVRTSHIPIILLTAKAGTENRIEGLEGGADDYIVKPFVARELLVRVKNLIDLRDRLRQKFTLDRLRVPGNAPGSSLEQAFLQRAVEIVERHLGDDTFGVDDFSGEIGLSRAQLHRKLVALTECSARDFLRRLRLERASELLQNNAGNVSEVAYQVGFRDPSHFAKCYRKQFGVPPGAVRPPDRMSRTNG